MTIDLKPEQQRTVDFAVGSGAFESASDVLDQAFEILREQLVAEDWLMNSQIEIAAHIDKGFLQAERGESIDGDSAMEMLRNRRTEFLKTRA